jgi:ceramide glucosyltransferase
VETYLPAYTFRGFFEHQMRWARSTRDSRRLGYIGLLFTFGLPWAIFSVLFAPLSWWSWTALAAAAALRAAVAIKVGVGVVHDRAIWRYLWLVPVRDLVAFAVWFGSFAAHTVHWRGEVFILQDGKIRPAHSPAPIVTAAKPDHDKVSAHW